jgi:hypothetical protein
MRTSDVLDFGHPLVTNAATTSTGGRNCPQCKVDIPAEIARIWQLLDDAEATIRVALNG